MKVAKRVDCMGKNIKNDFSASFKYSLFMILLLAGLFVVPANASNEKPNIVFIYADDLGYGDVGVYNPKSQIPTPNIDQLARSGLRFTDAHSSHATCTGSRYGLLTGTSSVRSGVRNTMLKYGPAIDPDEMTIADLLKGQGYITQMVGKWHLGFETTDKTISGPLKGGPVDCGFDYYYGSEGSSIEHARIKGRSKEDLPINMKTHNRVLCDDAVRVITEYGSSNQDKKLFLYYAPHEPHNPHVPESQFVGASGAGAYGDYVVQLDHWVGRIVQALKESHLEENTIVIFASDNGAQTKFTEDYPDHSPNWIFSGGKAMPYEGGHRLPFIVRWPGVVPASTVSKALINQTDFFATLADYFNVDLAKQYPGNAKDSYSFLPILKNPTLSHHRPPMAVVGSYRKENWKIIVDGNWSTGREEGDFKLKELFNLDNDISEKNNVLGEFPKIGTSLFDEYSKFLGSRELKPRAEQVNQRKRKQKSRGKQIRIEKGS